MSSLMYPRHQKNPITYTIPFKAARSSWYIQPYVPHSYKILVPLIKIGERLPLSTSETIQFNNRLDRQGFVKLPEDVHLFMQKRGMQHEIQVWREGLTQLRNRLKRVNFPRAGGYIVLDTCIETPQDPQELQDDPKPLADLLEDFFGPIQKDQLTAAILMFYQKREFDQDTRIYDDWEALFWPKLSPGKLPAEIEGGGPDTPVIRNLGMVGGDLGRVKAEPTKDKRNLKVTVEDVPELSKPLDQLESFPALSSLRKDQVGKTKLEDEGMHSRSAPLAAVTIDTHETSCPTADGIAYTSAIPTNSADVPSVRDTPITYGPTPSGGRRRTWGTPATPASPMPGFRVASATKSAKVQSARDRLGSKSWPPARPIPVSGSVNLPLPSEELSPDETTESTSDESQEGGSTDRPTRGEVFRSTESDNLTFVLQGCNIYPHLKKIERWFQGRIVTPFIVVIALYNSLLVFWWVWEWRYGSYKAEVAKGQAGQAPSRQHFSFDGSKRFLQSGKLREQPNMQELDEDWPPLSSYEREREIDLEWDRMAYLLEHLAEDVEDLD
ncbi:hypothetical protein L211DRAFT_850668 [Terfezia boudieri ATCC MYA-4762]|uniref:Uncharacterized protein n=1 Tax=Terfezia boudieri ATCC MYA-4762 TaxID=1051890 RepID=A0A3N4LHI4_9PEZI|nr:hypothetical protein L211DRAFT_850668 [Terfezia boudieri ATCC MYA-4762]